MLHLTLILILLTLASDAVRPHPLVCVSGERGNTLCHHLTRT